MFRKMIALVAILALTGIWLLRQPSAEAQQPCVPVSPFSTVCAPVQTVRILCPNQMLPYAPLVNYQAFGYNPLFANYYGSQVPIFNGYYYGWNSPVAVTIDSAGNITQVTNLPDSRYCQALATATAVPPAPAATPIIQVVDRIVERQVPVAVSQPAILPSIRPPSTGDAGLLTLE